MLFASFNGGPTDVAALAALVAPAFAAVLLGVALRRPLAAFFAAGVVGAVLCGGILIAGTRPGDAAGFFLSGLLTILCPLCGVLGGLLAAATAWGVRAAWPRRPGTRGSD